MSSHHGAFSSLSQPSRMLLHTTRPGLRSKKEPPKKLVSSLASGCAAIVPGQRSQDICSTGQARAIIAWPCSREYCRTAEKPRMPPIMLSIGPEISARIAGRDDGVVEEIGIGVIWT